MKQLIFIAGIFVIFAQCSSTKIVSHYINKQIIVDGSINDWEGYSLVYNEDWPMLYGTVHSDSMLWLVFSFNDTRLIRAIAQRDITLWFSEDKNFGLCYQEGFSDTLVFWGSIRHKYIPKGQFSVTAKDTVITPDLSAYPLLEASYKEHDGLYCLEFGLPLTADYLQAVLNTKSMQKIRLGIELAAFKRDKMRGKGGPGRTGGRNPGIFGGGGQGGGFPGPGRAPRKPVDLESKAFWFDVLLQN